MTAKDVTRRQFLVKAINITIGGICAVASGGILYKLCGNYSTKVRPVRNPAFEAIDESDGTVICYTMTASGDYKAFSLNACAARIWRMCDGEHTEKDIASILAMESGRSEDECLTAVRHALAIFNECSLITLKGKIKVYNRIIRREYHGDRRS